MKEIGLKKNKKVYDGLNQIYGIGQNLSKKLCDQLGLSPEIRIKQLKNSELQQLNSLIYQKLRTGPILKRIEKQNIQRLVRIASYRGFRHTQNLPVRGQRTHSNSQTARRRA